MRRLRARGELRPPLCHLSQDGGQRGAGGGGQRGGRAPCQPPPPTVRSRQRCPRGRGGRPKVSGATRGSPPPPGAAAVSPRSVTMTAQEPRSPAPAAPGASPPPHQMLLEAAAAPCPPCPLSPSPRARTVADSSPQPPAAPLRPDGAAAAAPPEGVPRGAGAAAPTCARGRRGAALSRSAPAWGRRRWGCRYRYRCRCRCRCGRCRPRPCGPALPRLTPALPLAAAARGGDVTASHPNTTPGPALRIRRKGAGRGGTRVTMATGTSATGAWQPSLGNRRHGNRPPSPCAEPPPCRLPDPGGLRAPARSRVQPSRRAPRGRAGEAVGRAVMPGLGAVRTLCPSPVSATES